MPHEVIMPALGMAQDTGRLVAWLKAVGDEVAADDVLMEVETDKSTMEVEAGAAGTVADLRAEAGEDVPVGQVVALIAAPGEEGPVAGDGPDAGEASGGEAGPDPAPVAEDAGTAPAAPRVAPELGRAPGDKVLASPKAKRLAAERGIVLADLVAAGMAQPIHAADLDRAPVPAPAADLEAPEPAVPGPAQIVPGGPVQAATSRATATLSADGVDAFAARMEGAGIEVSLRAMATAFAAAAFAEATGATSVSVAASAPGEDPETLLDPHLRRLSAPQATSDRAPDLTLRDLSTGRIADLRLAGDALPLVQIHRADDRLTLTLDFNDTALAVDAAIALIAGLAERLETPMLALV